MQDRTGSDNHEARSCGTGEEPHHARDPITADLRRAKKQFEGDRPASHVSHIVDAGDSGGYVAPYEIDMDDDPAEREARRRGEAE